MIGELLSSGRIVSLPANTDVHGFPPGIDPEVVLMLPFGRMLVGCRVLGGLEQWLWGKAGVYPWKELSLFPDHPLHLSIAGLGTVSLSQRMIAQLRRHLLSRATPPGDHFLTIRRLGGLLGKNEVLSPDPGIIWRTFLVKPHLRRAYWGVRFGLLWGGADMVERIGVWLRYAPTAFEGLEEYPSIWMALSGIPTREIRQEIGIYGFEEDRFFQLRSGDANPSVFRSEKGYLLHYLHEGFVTRELATGVPFRIWLFLPSVLWERLRNNERVPLREILLAWWGYAEARQSENWFRPYRLSGEKPLSLGEPVNAS